MPPIAKEIQNQVRVLYMRQKIANDAKRKSRQKTTAAGNEGTNFQR